MQLSCCIKTAIDLVILISYASDSENMSRIACGSAKKANIIKMAGTINIPKLVINLIWRELR